MRKVLFVLIENARTGVFLIGLAVLCGSVAHWSPAAAGSICGFVLMAIAAWPLLNKPRNN